MVEDKRAFKILTGKPTEKRPLESLRHRWDDNIRIDVNMRKWIDSAKDRDYWRELVNAALNLQYNTLTY